MEESEVYMISFSGGRTSSYMTERLLMELSPDRTVICFANTGKEEPETLDFVHACDQYWGARVNWLEYDPLQKFGVVNYATASRKGEPYSALIEKRKYLPNVVMRFCTRDLKIRVIKHFMLSKGHRYWTNIVGIRYDEPARWSKAERIAERERWDIWLPLVSWRVTKAMVLEYWKSMPFDLRLEHYQGNCDLCFLKDRNKIRRLITEHPEKADWWIAQEDKVKGTFRKEFSYKRFLDSIKKSPTLFDYEDPDLECICNLD